MVVQVKLEPGRAQELRLAGERLCLDFANTLDPRHGADATDFLTGYSDLAMWAGHAAAIPRDDLPRLLAEAERRPDEAQATFERARSLRESVYGSFAAIAAGRSAPGDDLQLLEVAYAEAMGHARLGSVGRGYAWTWQDDPLELERPLWPVARSAAELLTTGELERIHECPGAGECGWLFFDTSRNRSRRWCSMESCGNRAKGRRHYRRTHPAAGRPRLT
jgi:predicted RNA-binding Zn ribbon-like protein